MSVFSSANKSLAVSASLTFLVFSLFPASAHAYIDPNTGGYAFQILFPVISAIVGGYLFFKKQLLSMCRKIAGLFGKKSNS